MLCPTRIPNQTWPLPSNAVGRYGYTKKHPEQMVQFFSNYNTNKQATSKIWPLSSFVGFLPYKRDIAKITKGTNINKKTHTEE